MATGSGALVAAPLNGLADSFGNDRQDRVAVSAASEFESAQGCFRNLT
jgi:hypothetical protein